MRLNGEFKGFQREIYRFLIRIESDKPAEFLPMNNKLLLFGKSTFQDPDKTNQFSSKSTSRFSTAD
jgi:hypothetical protein